MPSVAAKLRYKHSEKGRVQAFFDGFKYHYGLTEDGFFDRLRSQEWTCPVCGLLLYDGGGINVDHVPGSNPPDVRAIVHAHCNNLVARVESGWKELKLDDPRYSMLVDYISSHGNPGR